LAAKFADGIGESLHHGGDREVLVLGGVAEAGKVDGNALEAARGEEFGDFGEGPGAASEPMEHDDERAVRAASFQR
jgi:hypothetical protein